METYIIIIEIVSITLPNVINQIVFTILENQNCNIGAFKKEEPQYKLITKGLKWLLLIGFSKFEIQIGDYSVLEKILTKVTFCIQNLMFTKIY